MSIIQLGIVQVAWGSKQRDRTGHWEAYRHTEDVASF